MIVKTCKVNNPDNMVIQIPRFIVKDWNLSKGDEVQLVIRDGKILIEPKRAG